MPFYASADACSEAPEVTQPYDAPIPAVDHRSGLQPVPSQYHRQKAGLVASTTEVTPYRTPDALPTIGRRPLRRKILWISVTVVAGLVSLGIGIGIGHAAAGADGQHSKGPSAAVCAPAQTVTVTTSGSSSATATTSSAPVTSGATGIADFTCGQSPATDTYTSRTNSGHSYQFIEDCFTNYANGGATNNGTGIVSDLRGYLVYTFQACMDSCADFNDDHKGTTQCLAVTYTANVTDGVANFQGSNCWLKSARGPRVSTGTTLRLTASAYLSSEPFA